MTNHPRESLRKLMNRSNHNCFGCSPGNDKGLRMEFYTDEKAVFSWVTIPPHLCGWETLAHGGVISTVMDEVMSWTTIYLLKTFILTKSITVDFLKPVFVETEVRAEGRVVEKISDREALIEGSLYNAENVLCARSRGTFALISLDFMKRMGRFQEEEIEEFRQMLEVRTAPG